MLINHVNLYAMASYYFIQYHLPHVLIKKKIFFLISVIDCLLSEWGPWSECDAKCGTGSRSRTRSILRAPENGGKHCASLTQKQGCEGYKCKSLHERKALSGEFGSFFINDEMEKILHCCLFTCWSLNLISLFKIEFRNITNCEKFSLARFSLIDWVSLHLSANKSCFPSSRQKRRCCCRQSFRKVDVKMIQPTSDGISSCATQTCTNTIEITSE